MSANYAKELRKLLRDAGCTFVRPGKGDHEIWPSPLDGKHFSVESVIESRHTANAALR